MRERAAALQADLAGLRDRLHREPELGLHLPRTQRTILDALDGLGLDVRRGTAATSVIGILDGDAPGPTVFLRADLDALPAEGGAEEPGAMHACGHDLHAAMLVGAARLLCEAKPARGRVVLLWQPGEEGHDGMRAMLGEDLGELVESAGDDAASYGLHVLAGSLPRGVFAGRAGASHAATASFTVRLRGPGGHGAFPHQAPDPVVAAADLITRWQTRIARDVDIFDPAVLTVGAIRGGEAANAIAGLVTLEGTTRCFSPARQQSLAALVAETAHSVAASHGVSAEVDYLPGYPPVVNDAEEVARFAEVVAGLLGADRYTDLPAPLPAGDDYALLLDRVPGAFLMVGAGLPGKDGIEHPNHSPSVVFDPAVLADGAAVLAAVALARLGGPAAGAPSYGSTRAQEGNRVA
ncbi:MAG: amidohydrolase [Nocardioidaceae bacterium]|nr:amidohydrolase [Nocardioidaceae bacterium]